MIGNFKIKKNPPDKASEPEKEVHSDKTNNPETESPPDRKIDLNQKINLRQILEKGQRDFLSKGIDLSNKLNTTKEFGLSKKLRGEKKESSGKKLNWNKSFYPVNRSLARKTGKDGKPVELPEIAQLEAELKREKKRTRYHSTLRSTVYALVVVAAVAVLIATIFLPVLRIYGSSMAPTVNEGEVVVSLKGADFNRGDILAVYYGNKLLVKRCIAGPGQWVDIDQEGNVSVDNEPLNEPYLIEKAYGDCTITLPYQVPEGRYFVMGDNRSISQDSRNAMVGCIAEEQIVGKIVFRVWPFSEFGHI